jgi:hypothetical protein
MMMTMVVMVMVVVVVVVVIIISFTAERVRGVSTACLMIFESVT